MPARKVKALTRTLEMLKVIPVAPKFVTAKQIHQQLLSYDPDVTVRTVQRDLMELTEVMGLSFGESPDGHKWQFVFNSPNQFIPAISKEEALSLKLVQEHLQLFLPSHVFKRLGALFKKSDDILSNTSDSKNWHELVCSMPHAIQFTPFDVEQAHIDTLYNALMDKTYLNITYGKKQRSYKIKPLGVIIRDAKLVLVCQYEGFKDVRNLLVHRIRLVEALEESFTTGFSLKRYIESQSAAVLLTKEKVELVFEATGYVQTLLSESALDDSQQIDSISDVWSKVTVKVSHTIELENWLLSQLNNIKLIGPASVKQRVLEKAKQAALLNSII